MNNMLKNIFVFAFGAALGSAVTWKIVKTKYEQIAQEEIDSVKEVFGKKFEPKTTEPKPYEKPDLSEYVKRLNEVGYSDPHANKEEGGSEVKDRPYVITPEEFGEADGYDAVSLIYYADGVLTDDWNEKIEDVDGTVGLDSLNHFGEYEDDSVYVRNDRLKTEYEILLDVKNYEDVVNSSHDSDEE